MPATISRPKARPAADRVTPSVVDPSARAPFTLEQELKPFGAWAGETVWVPPKDASTLLAETMLRETRPFTSQEVRWAAAVDKHRAQFTQVREIDLYEASIRLPRGKFFVTVTEQQDFDKITDKIPACVQTRLDEFLAGPGKQRGVKVTYLKPLCVESGEELILTTRDDLTRAIEKIQAEVFAEYARLAPGTRTVQALSAVANTALALPRTLMSAYIKRRQRVIDAYQAKLEFERRKRALATMQTLQRCRKTPCNFDDMLALTSPLEREHVIHQYCEEQELSPAQRRQLMLLASNTIPWFVALSLTVTYIASTSFYATTPIIVCDPAFVAEMPDNPGVLLKIGHFDEVGGVMHVEI